MDGLWMTELCLQHKTNRNKVNVQESNFKQTTGKNFTKISTFWNFMTIFGITMRNAFK